MKRHRPPPLVALRAFEVAARRLSFAAAADELHVTPTAVSHQMRRLEEVLGCRLFVRHNRSVTLTDIGRDLAGRLYEVFALLDNAIEVTREPRRSPLQISAMPSLAAKWLAPRLGRFEAKHPQWSIRLVAADHLVSFIHEDVDVGVRYGAGKYPGHHVEPLMQADAFPVCSPGLLVEGCRALREPDDLRFRTLLHDETSRRSDSVPNWTTWLKAAGASKVRPDRGPVFGGIHLALEAAIAGHGVALGLAPLVAEDLAAGRLVRPFVFAQRNSFSFWIVTSKARAESPKIRAFRRWAIAEAKATVGAPPAS